MNSNPIPPHRFVVNDLMAFSAEELAEHASDLANKIRSGGYEENGDLSLPVDLRHLMDHVLTIWHLRNMSDEDYERQGQPEYEVSCKRIPRFDEDYELVDAD